MKKISPRQFTLDKFKPDPSFKLEESYPPATWEEIFELMKSYNSAVINQVIQSLPGKMEMDILWPTEGLLVANRLGKLCIPASVEMHFNEKYQQAAKWMKNEVVDLLQSNINT